MRRGIKSAFAGNVPGERKKEDNGETMSKRNDLSNRINEKFMRLRTGQHGEGVLLTDAGEGIYHGPL